MWPILFYYRTFDDEDPQDEANENVEFNENFLSSLSHGAGINDSSSDPAIDHEKLYRSISCKIATQGRYNTRSFEIDNPSFESTTGTGDDNYHTSLDSYNQGNEQLKHRHRTSHTEVWTHQEICLLIDYIPSLLQ